MRRLALLLALLPVLVACGGSTTTTTVTVPQTPVLGLSAPPIAGLPPASCQDVHSGQNYLMQCGAFATGQVPTNRFGLGTFGTDTYGSSNPATAAKFNCTYLSGQNGGKDWTAAGLALWHNRGKPTCAVWETYATRALAGFSAGQQDARVAQSEAARIGIPTYAALRFAVDTDTSAAAVRPYFDGVKSILGSRTGAYGSYYVVGGLEADGVTTPRTDWQTIAWSFGHWGRACLEQTSINNWLDGQSVDFDRAICNDWGQFPAKQAHTIICFGTKAQGNATCQKVHADVRAWQKAVTSSLGAYKARGCIQAVADRNTLQGRWEYFDTALRQHPNVLRAKRLRARAATGRVLNRVRGHIHKAGCLTFAARADHYAGLITKAKRQYS